jgi:hypothetical protein
MNPFDFVDSITFSKKNLIEENPDLEKEYNAFMVNRSLSYFADTILEAHEMTVNYHLDNKLQYDYLFHSITKRKRFSKWAKRKQLDKVEIVKQYYGLNNKKALRVAMLLSDDQIKIIKKKMEKGGVL